MSTGVPEKGALLQNGEKHKVTIHRAPHGQKAYVPWGAALFPNGSKPIKDTKYHSASYNKSLNFPPSIINPPEF
jgi:hypothetical protein